MPAERLTIDVTVARDYLDQSEARHEDAVKLFRLAQDGAVELATAPQGYRLDVTGDLAEQLDDMLAEEGVESARQLAYLSTVTYPDANLFPGHVVEGFGSAWQQLIETWRSHEGKPPGDEDQIHVETHVADGRDVFITDDRALRAMCRRLRDEHDFPVESMGLAEYLQRFPLTRR
jgi:hypothetical protein